MKIKGMNLKQIFREEDEKVELTMGRLVRNRKVSMTSKKPTLRMSMLLAMKIETSRPEVEDGMVEGGVVVSLTDVDVRLTTRNTFYFL